MKLIILSIIHSIKEFLYIPSRLIELIKKQEIDPIELVKPNDITSIIQWHNWPERSFMHQDIHFFLQDNDYSYPISSEELDSLIIKSESIETIEIQEINSLSASKSDLTKLSSLNEAAHRISQQYIAEISIEKLNENLDHLYNYAWAQDEIFLDYYSWYDKNYYWQNSDGSHHFIAAKYIAEQIGHKIYQNARITRYDINKSALNEFLAKYKMFLVAGKYYKLGEFLKKYKCLYAFISLPSPLFWDNQEVKILIIPNNGFKSRSVINALNKYKFISWNKYMTTAL